MMNNIFFIGGIHGVGKSTICQHICEEFNLEYLSASQLIKWRDINEDTTNKKVNNVLDTQDRLILGLNQHIKKDKYYLLDGHFCLINTNDKVEYIPLDTFKQINPINLNLITDDISEIIKRLRERDNNVYKTDLLEELQNCEISHAQSISKELDIDLNIGTPFDYSQILEKINTKIK